MADDEDVPPLEDMSELLQQVDALKEHKKSANSPVQPVPDSKENGDYIQPQHKPTKKESPPSNDLQKPKPKSDFGGMKKGFLFGAPVANKKSTPLTQKKSSDDVPFLKPKESKESQYKMPEVQQALNASEALLKNKDWITGDMLSKVQNNEAIAKRLGDPQFMQAIAEFQTNPMGAMQKYKDNKEIQSFLQAFCGLMGDHFTGLADQQDPSQKTTGSGIQVVNPEEGADMSVRSSTNPKQATAADERRMQDILSDPETHDILMDPRVQMLMETLRTDPEKAQRVLETPDADFRKKIKKLVDVGLLQFQS